MKKILIILATIGLLYSCSNDDSNENLNLNEVCRPILLIPYRPDLRRGFRKNYRASEDWTLVVLEVEATPSTNKSQSAKP